MKKLRAVVIWHAFESDLNKIKFLLSAPQQKVTVRITQDTMAQALPCMTIDGVID